MCIRDSYYLRENHAGSFSGELNYPKLNKKEAQMDLFFYEIHKSIT